MSWRDRPYAQSDYNSPSSYRSGGSGMGGLMTGLPRLPQVVKYLLIINFTVFVLQILGKSIFGLSMSNLFGAMVGRWWQVWRYVTFQFLHDPKSLWHIGLNMLGLYMLGSPLAQHWGPRRFLKFYLVCGAVGGMAYVAVGALLDLPHDYPIIGASSGIFAVLLACAVLFPHFRLIVFLFPVPIRLVAVFVFGGMILVVLSSLGKGAARPEFWSDVCHLGGAATAAVWIWVLPKIRMRFRSSGRSDKGRWEAKLERRQEQQEKIDRILDKIRREGIGSLRRREKQLLREATEEMKND